MSRPSPSTRIGGMLLALIALAGCASERSARATEANRDAAVAAAVAVPVAPPPPSAPVDPAPRCREQRAQDFLLRDGQIAKIGASKAERDRIQAARARSIDYRTREYGFFHGFGHRSDNPHPPAYYAEHTTFMGLSVLVNKKIVPALACVEAALRRDCAATPYQPRELSGLRDNNTYTDYEVSNHVYGIAIDVDPGRNPCCHCVGKWPHSPACKKKVASEFERMAMPKCWVDVFERYGFHWLGHDELGDTMHFEFLGDPDHIVQ